MVLCLGGGTINWEFKEVYLNKEFNGKIYYNTQELLTEVLKLADQKIYGETIDV